MQNQALERQGHEVRVDHRSLAAQREAALAQGHDLRAEELDRAPEVKLGPAASAIERREARVAELEGRDYAPVTEHGAAVHEARQERVLLAELRARVELARETYVHAREDGADRVTAGLAALRAAAQKHGLDREHGRDVSPEHAPALEAGSMRERLARILDRGIGRREAEVSRETGPEHDQDDIRARLGSILGSGIEKDHAERSGGTSGLSQESRDVRERRQQTLARDKLAMRKELDQSRTEVVHRHRDKNNGYDHDL